MRNRKEELAKLAESGQIASALKQVTRWKKEPSFKVDLDIYNSLIYACSLVGLPNEARAFIADMHLMGVQPDINTFCHLLNAEKFSRTHVLHQVFDMIYAHGLKPNATAYHRLILRYTAERQLEMCLRILAEMATQNVVPMLSTVQTVVRFACHLGFANIATDITREFEQNGVRRLGNETWMNCLSAYAEELDADGVLQCWQVLKDQGCRPHEGLLLQVLHTAARHGLKSLAFEAVEAMKSLGPTFEYAPYHLEPLVEACCQAGDLKSANETVQMMRQRLVCVPRALTLFRPRDEDKSPHHLDEVWTALQALSEAGETVDLLLFNSLCLAALRQSEPQHAFGYLRMASDLKLEPTAIKETYQLLIDEIREIGDTDIEETLISMAKDQGVEIQLNPRRIDGWSLNEVFRTWRGNAKA